MLWADDTLVTLAHCDMPYAQLLLSLRLRRSERDH
jgi:hypothetical protein